MENRSKEFRTVSYDVWKRNIEKSISIYSKLIDYYIFDEIYTFTLELYDRLNSGGKLIMFGNGGSAADCDHIVGEFRNRFLIDRKPVMAMSLANSISTITAIGNDFSYDEIFSRQLTAICSKNDSVIALSTSGTSRNITKAFNELHDNKELYKSVDSLLISGVIVLDTHVKRHIEIPIGPSKYTVARIQEATMFVLHMMCFFYDSMSETK